MLHGAGSTLCNISNGQVTGGEGKKGCNGFSRPFWELYKNWQQARVMWANSWQDCPCLAQTPASETAWFFSTRLHILLYEFLLASDYHKILLVLSCSIALLTMQSKSTVTQAVQSRLSGRDAGGAGGARPKQLPCPDPMGSGIYHILTFSVACYKCPTYHTFTPINHTFLCVYQPFCCYLGKKTIYMWFQVLYKSAL